MAPECKLCGSKEAATLRTKVRGGVERKVFRCAGCGLVYLEPRDGDLREYYREEYRKVYTPAPGQVAASEEIFRTYLPMQQIRLDKLSGILRKDARLLDIGCSAGQFLKAAAPHVGEAMGIEYNASDAAFVRGMGFTVWSSPIEETDIPEQSLDIVTVYQTFEHVPEPQHFLKSIGRYLKPEGFLVIEVPNVRDPLLTVFANAGYEDFYYKEAHLFYYAPDTLRQMVERTGFAGSVTTIQRYHVLNSLWWMLTGTPQKSATVGMGTPVLPVAAGADPAAAERFQRWIREADAAYKKMILDLNLGESLFFIGTKKS